MVAVPRINAERRASGSAPLRWDDADMQAKWYYRLKKAYGGWSEGAFENPVRETTLRWRS